MTMTQFMIIFKHDKTIQIFENKILSGLLTFE